MVKTGNKVKYSKNHILTILAAPDSRTTRAALTRKRGVVLSVGEKLPGAICALAEIHWSDDSISKCGVSFLENSK